MAELKTKLVEELLAAKAASGKTFTQIGKETGLTNAYVGQLFHRQAQLHEEQATVLCEAVPGLTPELVDAMKSAPIRSYDPQLIQDPTVYRLNEAVMHYAQTLKEIINEDFGDGIMSGIGFYCSVDKIQGKDGEARVLISMNGKFLPHTVQKANEHQNFGTSSKNEG